MCCSAVYIFNMSSWRCKTCQYVFVTEKALREHMFKRHGQLKCPLCRFYVTNCRHNYRRHICNTHKNKVVCFRCGSYFTNSYNFVLHVSHEHDNEFFNLINTLDPHLVDLREEQQVYSSGSGDDQRPGLFYIKVLCFFLLFLVSGPSWRGMAVEEEQRRQDALLQQRREIEAKRIGQFHWNPRIENAYTAVLHRYEQSAWRGDGQVQKVTLDIRLRDAANRLPTVDFAIAVQQVQCKWC